MTTGEQIQGRSPLVDASFGRLLGVLVAPVKTFASIARRPTWLAPMLVLSLLGTGLGLLVSQRMDFTEAARKRIAQQGVKISEEQLDRQMAMVKKLAPYGAVGAGLIVFPAFDLLLAAVFWVAFKMVGGESSYLASLSAFLHGSMPSAIASLLAIPIVFFGRSTLSAEEMQRSGGVLLSSAAAFAPDGAGPALLALLGSLDLFVLWCLTLWVLGFQTANGVSRKLAFTVVAVLWVLYVAGKVGLASLSLSMFG